MYARYLSIYLEPPLAEWGFYRVATIPLWRIAHQNCNLVLITTGEELKDMLTCCERWGFGIRTVTPYKKKLTVWAYRGDPLIPDMTKTPLQALRALPGPRLAMNAGKGINDFDQWDKDGWNRVDPYRYPIRENYVEVNYHILSLFQEVREAMQVGEEWRFRIGDVINEIVAQGYTQVEAVGWVRAVSGLAVQTLLNMSVLAEHVQIKDRAAHSWADHCRRHGLKIPRGSGNVKKERTSELGIGSKGET